jgi:hypothetical protein
MARENVRKVMPRACDGKMVELDQLWEVACKWGHRQTCRWGELISERDLVLVSVSVSRRSVKTGNRHLNRHLGGAG